MTEWERRIDLVRIVGVFTNYEAASECRNYYAVQRTEEDVRTDRFDYRLREYNTWTNFVPMQYRPPLR